MRIPDTESLRLRFRNDAYLPATRKARRKKIAVQDFTIISNNCWGGTVYESYGLKKNSPTVGMFIMPDDFLALAADLEGVLSRPLQFISPDESKWRGQLGTKANWGTYLIGRVGDLELHMLHYHDEAAAKKKWESRIRRINMDRLIFKFNDQNGCEDEHAVRFDALDLDHKVFFTVKDYPGLSSAVKIRQPGRASFVRASYEPIGANRSFNVNRFLNSSFQTGIDG